MRNGTKATGAMISFKPQSATANDTHNGTRGPVFRNGTTPYAQITSSAATALKPIKTVASAIEKKIAVSTIEPANVLPSGAGHHDQSPSWLNTTIFSSCANKKPVANAIAILIAKAR